MPSFGDWLRQTPFTLSEVARLRTAAAAMGASWPAASSLKSDYESSIDNKVPDAQKKSGNAWRPTGGLADL
jgi:hypothetical protein